MEAHTVTPQIVASLGATCTARGVQMPPGQQGLLVPFKMVLARFCELAKLHKTKDFSPAPAQLYWNGRGPLVSFLGPEINGIVYNLLQNEHKPHTPQMKEVQPFGTPLTEHTRHAIFFAEHRLRFGSVVEHSRKIVKMRIGRVIFKVFVALVAPVPVVDGDHDLSTASGKLPKPAQQLVHILHRQLGRCHNEHIKELLREAVAAVKLLKLSTTQGLALAERIAKAGDELQHARAQDCAVDLTGAADQLALMAVRVQVATLAHRPAALRHDTSSLVQLFLQQERSTDQQLSAAARRGLELALKVDPELAGRLQLHGVLQHQEHSAVTSDYDAVIQVCSGTSGMDHLATLAKKHPQHTKDLSWALEKSTDLTAHCRFEANKLVEKLQKLDCRLAYEAVLGRKFDAKETNAALALEVLAHFEGKEIDPTLTQCLSGETLSPELRERLSRTTEAEEAVRVKLLAFVKGEEAKLLAVQQKLQATCAQIPLTGLLNKGGLDLAALDGAVSAARALLPEHIKETEQDMLIRQTCDAELATFQTEVQRTLCRIRLAKRAKHAGTDVQLAHFGGQGEADALDSRCVDVLDATSAELKKRAGMTSTRQCTDPNIHKAVSSFCAKSAELLLPVNFLDFLAVLLLASLPGWHTSQAQAETWLSQRRQRLGGATRAGCGNQAEIIKLHASTGLDAAHSKLQVAVRELLVQVAGGLHLPSLSQCACNSPSILAHTTREKLQRSSNWYWVAGARLLHGVEARVVSLARQRVLDRALQAMVTHVSVLGNATLHPDDDVLGILWQSYLQELVMHDGILNVVLPRIQGGSDCEIAEVDTLFFVVLLDLVDASQGQATANDKIIEKAVTGGPDFETSSKAALVGAVGSGMIGATSGLGPVAGLAVAASSGITGAALGVMGLSALTFKHAATKFMANKPQDLNSLLEAKKDLFRALAFRKTKVNELLVQLCQHAQKGLATRSSKTSMTPQDRALAWQQRQPNVVPKMDAPSLFPLGPPSGSNPSNACNGGVC